MRRFHRLPVLPAQRKIIYDRLTPSSVLLRAWSVHHSRALTTSRALLANPTPATPPPPPGSPPPIDSSNNNDKNDNPSNSDAPPPPPPDSEDSEGRSDWFYVTFGILAVVLFGGPPYGIYKVQTDLETRRFVMEDFPEVYELLEKYVDMDEYLPLHIRHVEIAPPEQEALLITERGEAFPVRVSSDTTLQSYNSIMLDSDPVVDVYFPPTDPVPEPPVQFFDVDLILSKLGVK